MGNVIQMPAVVCDAIGMVAEFMVKNGTCDPNACSVVTSFIVPNSKRADTLARGVILLVILTSP
jgi:hypothetical protein